MKPGTRAIGGAFAVAAIGRSVPGALGFTGVRTWLVITTLLLLVSPAVNAEDLVAYDTEGDADVGGSDPRVAALDEAFARAVTLAIGELVAPDVRSAQRAVLDREFTGRARIWVAKFTVTKDRTADDRRTVKVTVRVDRDKLRAKLAELAIPSMTATEASRGRSVAVLLRVTEPTGVRASFGAAAMNELPGLGALSSALRGGGMAVKRAPAGGPVARAQGDLPLADDEAEALAGQAKAELAAIAGVSIGPAVVVRGLPISAALVTAHVRLLERRGMKVVGQGTASVASRGTEASVMGRAVDQALVAAASDVVAAPRQTLRAAGGFQGDDTPVLEPGTVLVRLAPRTPWGLVVAEQRYLAGAKGVQRAVLRRLSPGGWVIGVTTTESVDRIAQIARKAPAIATTAKVRVQGEIVELELVGAP
jgi:hypothetical protein